MSLRHILLGMLAEPQSGYDLKKEFTKSLRNFWNAELSQIYPLLGRMEKEGLLSVKQIASSEGPPKKVYTRSAKGRRELVAWLASGPTVGEERISYLAQVYFLDELDDIDESIAFMGALREHMQRWLTSLEDIERGWRASDPRYPDDLPDADFYPQLTLALGLKKVTANLEWCDECLQRLRARRARERASKSA